MILYVGSYTEIITGTFGGHGAGIYCYDFDAVDGSLHFRHAHSGTNPSYLCIPSPGYLYTSTEVLETNKPRIQAFKIDPSDFSLQLLNEEEIPGGLPCHINFSKRNNCIMVACYETGNTMIYPVAAGGKLFPLAKVLQHEGSSVNKLRQERAHAHAVVINDDLSDIFVTDLGMDKVMVYHLNTANEKFEINVKQAITFPPGSGPRHMVVHAEAKTAYVINELTATVTMLRYDNGKFDLLHNFGTLPGNYSATPGAAAIRLSSDGKFIYISERGDNTITALRIDADREILEIIGRYKTHGKTPREINFDPTGNWLLAAHQDSDSIAIFKVDKNTGMIELANLVENILSPVCLAWLPVT
ncbi:MAG: lactonase family protein [Ginsengibacter sp.]